jgi:alkanesulfonate monooxygenase SsuD/methylene tetrahydromethanopterin reductase-like flavin-dependent oxidoreductase (luciferase family)
MAAAFTVSHPTGADRFPARLRPNCRAQRPQVSNPRRPVRNERRRQRPPPGRRTGTTGEWPPAETKFLGSPVQVADQLERLRDATAVDELITTTITYDHHDRVRSYQLLADERARR